MTAKALLAGVAVACGIGGAHAATLVVNSNADDGSAHTLRWAIETNNAQGGNNRIQINPTGNPHEAWVIRLDALLPPIKGPAVIVAKSRGTDKDAPEVVLDGSNFIDTSTTASCPAENGNGAGPNVRSLQKPALAVVDSGNVDISGLEIRNFCIGVMLLRSHDNHIHHNVIHDMVGAAGVMITGDDGTPAGGSTTGLSTNNLVEHNVIFDTGDGGECTRGTSNTTYQYNVFFQTSPDTVSPRSQGVECAGNGNTGIAFLHNTFTGYSDGLQLNSASNVTVIGNRIAKSTYGITTSGTDVLIQNNVITGNRMGVGPGGNARVTITQNQIYDNGQPILSLPTSAGGTTNPASPALLGIDLGVNGVTPNDGPAACGAAGPDCDTGPNELQNFPILAGTSTWSGGSPPALSGSLQSQPNASFVIEFFASHALNPAGFAEGEIYVGSMTVTTDASGMATFTFAGAPSDPLGDGSAGAYFTATATNANHATSEFSSAIRLSR